MNSKQLNFFSHPDEIDKIITFLISKKARITYEPFEKEKFNLFINSDFLKQENVIFKIIFFTAGEKKENIKFEFIESQKYFLIDSLESNIIQFSFPKMAGKNILERGRFYFVTGYWKNGKFIKKNDDFIDWATNVFKNFKKEFLKYKEPIHNENCTEMVKKMIDSKEIELKHF